MSNGVVLFGGDAKPPDGTAVTIEATEIPTRTEGTRQGLLRFAGIIKGDDLPTDGSFNHDHYLHGAPRK